MSDKVLEMYNLNKVYGEGDTTVHALQDVSITVNKGEFLLIVGSSGSGKSTLLNMIGLLDRPTSGKILIDGINTTTLNDGKISSFRNHKLANKISGGQAQRAAIARGLVNHPTIVLADEPTGNLDSVSAQKIVQLMKSTAKKLGQTFIVVTHDRHQFG